MKIGNNFKAYRKSKGIGQAMMAEIAGASITSISDWERGRNNPELSKLIKVAEYFNDSLDSIVFFNKNQASTPSREERQLIEKFRNSPQNIQQSIRIMLNI
ncbi:hypothetical protein COMNV_01641 [Commensalibacter sp. Nvir]|uniref:helix-turn-helix transcriptional regulator n=1 Tax=Commensalibacter sp. Nvir TaxID=3069817 RepID=UPI002D4F678A|nr:hypothetical protein COMNV_01641 [Commensalibacter sp. Nvir]